MITGRSGWKSAITLGLVAGLLGAGPACTTLATTHGARTLEPGQVQIQRALGVQTGGSFAGNAGIVIPQSQWILRVGLKPNLDLGARIYVAGLGTDLRYRFHQQGRWHFAIDPGFAILPIPASGAFEGRAPLLAEVDLHERFSLSFAAQAILRDAWTRIDSPELGKGSVGRLDTFAGGGIRAEYHSKRLMLGVSLDVAGQPARHAGLAWSGGFDASVRFWGRAPPAP